MEFNEFLSDSDIKQLIRIIRDRIKSCCCHDLRQEYNIVVKKLKMSVKERIKPTTDQRSHILRYYTWDVFGNFKTKHSTNINLTLRDLYLLDEFSSDWTICRTDNKHYIEWQILRTKILNEIIKNNK